MMKELYELKETMEKAESIFEKIPNNQWIAMELLYSEGVKNHFDSFFIKDLIETVENQFQEEVKEAKKCRNDDELKKMRKRFIKHIPLIPSGNRNSINRVTPANFIENMKELSYFKQYKNFPAKACKDLLTLATEDDKKLITNLLIEKGCRDDKSTERFFSGMFRMNLQNENEKEK